ncbi:MAG: LytTR family transcriptional regulator [Ignavibacteria bacterium]|nr:MAG: LytTR family transcriptional regulator [Ignavibacteria bacterium]
MERIPPFHRIGIYNLKTKNFMDWGKKDSSENYAELAFNEASGIKDGDLKYQAFSNMAELLINKGKYPEANGIINRLFAMKNLFNPVCEINSAYLKVKLLFNQKKYQESIKTGEQLIENAKKSGKEYFIKDTYKILAESYDSLDNIYLANSYLKIYSDFLERRKNGSNRRLESEIKAKYDVNKLNSKVESSYKLVTVTTILTILSIFAGIILLVWGVKSYKKYKQEEILAGKLEAEKEKHKENYLKLAESVERKAVGENGYIIINDKKIEYNDIISIKSFGHYLYYNLMSRKKPYLERNTLKEISSKLPKSNFIQIHRSHMINLLHVKSFEGNVVTLSKEEKMKVSRTFKPVFLDAFRSLT